MISVASPHCSSLDTFGLWNSLPDLKKKKKCLFEAWIDKVKAAGYILMLFR